MICRGSIITFAASGSNWRLRTNVMRNVKPEADDGPKPDGGVSTTEQADDEDNEISTPPTMVIDDSDEEVTFPRQCKVLCETLKSFRDTIKRKCPDMELTEEEKVTVKEGKNRRGKDTCMINCEANKTLNRKFLKCKKL